MKKRMLSLLCTLAMTCSLLTTTALAIENPFSDISSDSYLAQSVLWAYDNGVTAGTSDTEFSPDATCTRGQVVTFLWRAQGEPTPESNKNPFTDVTSDFYYYDAVLWAVEQGITSGTSDTEFSPDATCTTAQVLTFLYRANGEPNKTGEGLYYEDAVLWAAENDLTGDVAIDPDSQSPRSDIVTYLWLNAGAPEMEVTDPELLEVVEYRYTMPEVEEPGTATLTTEYFQQVFLYMLVNDLESYSCYFPGVSGYQLEDQGLESILNDSCFYIKDAYIELCGYHPGYYGNWTGTYSAVTVTVSLSSYSNMTHEELVVYRSDFIGDIETLVADFFDQGYISETDSDYTKALYFYRWCALNLQYNLNDSDSNYYGSGTLENGTGVCQGYVSIFNTMCNVAGIEAYGVSGTYNGGDHIWSYLNLDGSWVYADPTFGDPIPDRAGYCNEYYFALTKAEISRSHVFDDLWD